MLTLGRALQGLGAAGLMSVSSALVRYTYPRRQLGRGIALTSLVVSTSSATGPTIASAILSVASWPWLFAVMVPIGVVTILLSLWLLPRTEPSGHRFDLVSAALCAVMFGSLVCGINGVGHQQAAAGIAVEFAAAIVAGRLLLRRQAGEAMPLLPIDLFRRPVFSVSVTTSVLCFIAQGLAFVSLPFYLQNVIGVSAVTTGLLMTPWPATSALMAPFAGRLADRYSPGILGSIGLAIVGAGFVLLAFLPAHPGTLQILWRIAICGGGMGLFQQPNARAIILAAPRERSGGAGAIQSSARLLGQSIGAAMVALVFALSPHGGGSATALLIAAGFAALATVVSLSRQFDFVRAERPVAVEAE
jgi:MFS transporter, DHA2 family, multidrug resistance protein